ncbi:hypothetical protein MBLNU13_g02789t1 [Cladosporium sp. NU13]
MAWVQPDYTKRLSKVQAYVQHVFKCRHAVCDRCVERFGTRRTSEEYTYEFTDCFCCGNRADLLVRLKPPTAGVRVIGMDGGGLRGIVSLEFIGILQKSLGSSCQVQDLFDLAVGTSVGGLEALFLFVKLWDITNALKTFRRLAERCFSKAATTAFSSLGQLRSNSKGLFRTSS